MGYASVVEVDEVLELKGVVVWEEFGTDSKIRNAKDDMMPLIDIREKTAFLFHSPQPTVTAVQCEHTK